MPDRVHAGKSRPLQRRQGEPEAGDDQERSEPAARAAVPRDEAAEHVRERDPRREHDLDGRLPLVVVRAQARPTDAAAAARPARPMTTRTAGRGA